MYCGVFRLLRIPGFVLFFILVGFIGTNSGWTIRFKWAFQVKKWSHVIRIDLLFPMNVLTIKLD